MNLTKIIGSIALFSQLSFGQPVVENIDENKTKVEEVIKNEKDLISLSGNFENIISEYLKRGGKLSEDKIEKKLELIEKHYGEEIDKRIEETNFYNEKVSELINSINIEELNDGNFNRDLDNLDIINILGDKENNKISIETFALLKIFLKNLTTNLENLKEIKQKPIYISFLSGGNNNEFGIYNPEKNIISISLLNLDNKDNIRLIKTIIHETLHSASIIKIGDTGFPKLNAYNYRLINDNTEIDKLKTGSGISIKNINEQIDEIVNILYKDFYTFQNILFDETKKISNSEIKKFLKGKEIKFINLFSGLYNDFKSSKRLNKNEDYEFIKKYIDNYDGKITPAIKEYFINEFHKLLDEKYIEDMDNLVKKILVNNNRYSNIKDILESVNTQLEAINYKFNLESGKFEIDYGNNKKAIEIIEEYGLIYKLFEGTIDNTNLTFEQLKNKIIKLLKEDVIFLNLMVGSLSGASKFLQESKGILYKKNDEIFISKKDRDSINYTKNTKEQYVRLKMLQKYMINNNVTFSVSGIKKLYKELDDGKINSNDGAEGNALFRYMNQKENLLIILKDLI